MRCPLYFSQLHKKLPQSMITNSYRRATKGAYAFIRRSLANNRILPFSGVSIQVPRLKIVRRVQRSLMLKKRTLWVFFLRRRWLKKTRRILYPAVNSFLSVLPKSGQPLLVQYRSVKYAGTLDNLWKFQQFFWRRIIRRRFRQSLLRKTALVLFGRTAHEVSRLHFMPGFNLWHFFYKSNPRWQFQAATFFQKRVLFWKWNASLNKKRHIEPQDYTFSGIAMQEWSPKISWILTSKRASRKSTVYRNALFFRYIRFKGRRFLRKFKKTPNSSRRLRRKTRYKYFFTKKYLFKKIFSKFFAFPFVNWLALTHRRVRKNKRVHVRALWKAFDIYLRRYYFYNLPYKQMAGLCTANLAGRFDKILALRQRFLFTIPVLLVLCKFAPNIKIALLLLKQGSVAVDGLVCTALTSISISSAFQLNPFIFSSLIKWSLFAKEFFRYKMWTKRLWRSLKFRNLLSMQRLSLSKQALRPWVFCTEDGSSYSPSSLLKLSFNKLDLWSKINPWIWNLSMAVAPSFLEISLNFFTGIVFRWPFSFEILPYVQFSDRILRWYVRKFINTHPVRPKNFEVWKRFRVRRKF